MADVDVKFSHPWPDPVSGKLYETGSSGSFSAEKAADLIGWGIAVAATVADAKDVGVDPDTAASKRR